MIDRTFRELADQELAALTFTDAQRQAALCRMQKEDSPVMKHKAFTAVILLAALLLMSAAALAVTMNLPSIQELIDQTDHRTREYDYEPFIIDSAAIVAPIHQRHTSQLVNVELHEAYITHEALYLTLHVAPIGDSVVLWDDAAPPTADGRPLRYFDLYREEGLTLLDFQGLSLHSPLNGYDYTLFADYTEARRDPDGPGVTYLMAYPLPEDERIPLSSSTVLGKFVVLDCHSRKHEYNALLFDLPRMTIDDAHDSFLVN